MTMSYEALKAFDAAKPLLAIGADTPEVIEHCWRKTGYKPSEYQVKHWRNKVGVRRNGAQNRPRSSYEPEERRAIDLYKRLMAYWPAITRRTVVDQ